MMGGEFKQPGLDPIISKKSVIVIIVGFWVWDDDNFVEFPTSELSIKSMAADGMNIQCTRRLMMTYPSDDFDDDDTDNNADD